MGGKKKSKVPALEPLSQTPALLSKTSVNSDAGRTGPVLIESLWSGTRSSLGLWVPDTGRDVVDFLRSRQVSQTPLRGTLPTEGRADLRQHQGSLRNLCLGAGV